VTLSKLVIYFSGARDMWESCPSPLTRIPPSPVRPKSPSAVYAGLKLEWRQPLCAESASSGQLMPVACSF
jgi:hypothetical protein